MLNFGVLQCEIKINETQIFSCMLENPYMYTEIQHYE